MSAADVEPVDKTLATLQAEYALQGAELVRLSDGTLLAACGGWIKPLRDADDARAWLARLQGKRV